MGFIHVEGMEFYSYHGCFKEEQIIGTRFKVDVVIETDCELATKTDQINDALNYQTVYNLVKEEMAIKSHLLEHVAGRILDHLYVQFKQIEKASVKVVKLNPPLGGQVESVSVTLSR